MILITGMQRSGTSLVCQLLHALDVPFGDPAALLPADRWNRNGYFEATAVMDVNSRIVTGLARHGSTFGAWLSKVEYLRTAGLRNAWPPAADEATEERALRCRAEIEELGRRHAGGAVKDPRFCLTLRYWLRWTTVRHVVVCVRHPAGVVESLVRRHHLPRWLAARFHAHHVHALLDQLPAAGVHFVDVDRLVGGDVQDLDLLRRALGLQGGPSSHELLQRVVDPTQFTSTTGGSHCPRVALRAFERLEDRIARRDALASS